MTATVLFIASLLTVCAAVLTLTLLRRAEKMLRGVRLETLSLRSNAKALLLARLLAAENTRLVAKGIDQGSLFLQGSHRAISDVAFAFLELLPSTRGSATVARETHNLISAGLYGVFREVNRHVGEKIASDIEKKNKTIPESKKSASTQPKQAKKIKRVKKFARKKSR